MMAIPALQTCALRKVDAHTPSIRARPANTMKAAVFRQEAVTPQASVSLLYPANVAWIAIVVTTPNVLMESAPAFSAPVMAHVVKMEASASTTTAAHPIAPAKSAAATAAVDSAVPPALRVAAVES